ncbi:hypothetical protein AQJ67_27035 [Streptomyces caeruleatus]|uniref:Uncharacterized protein n=1 Tax=Streptomyces caeruleatus TaxID=661399 RepID=A0A117RMJ5_9ACTN|nr:hypothetical protein AQJ67_27035 [Streptomyces caeruleatus]
MPSPLPAPPAGPEEPVEDARRVLLAQPRTLVLDTPPDDTVRPLHAQPHRHVGGRVRADVAEQIAQHLTQPRLVACTSSAPSAPTVIGRSGCWTRRSSAASRTRRLRSTSRNRTSGRWSSRARVSSSSTRRPMRSTSPFIRSQARLRSAGSVSIPLSYSWRYPRIADSGVRSSCEASPT